MRRLVPLAAALLLLALALVWSTPRRAAQVPETAWRVQGPSVAGAFHVHTTRSDGHESVEAVAAAASRAGLRFVIFTDHGDGTAAPEPPVYQSSVLCIDGVEISTTGGHYAVIGLPQAPYPLAGDPRDVVEDVRRLGGVGVVTHGDSPRADLAWTDWRAPIDGLEWLNLDTVWRTAGARSVVRGLLGSWIRAPQALTSLASRPEAALARWDALTRGRHVIALASTDAHGYMVPSYDTAFRTLSTRVDVAAPLTGEAAHDAQLVIDAVKAGHHYSVVDALASPAAFAFTARTSRAAASEGDVLPAGAGTMLDVRVGAPAGARLRLFQNGRVWREAVGDHLEQAVGDEPAVYRVEVQVPGAPGDPPLPWIVSNPIFVGAARSGADPDAAVTPPVATRHLLAERDWTVEHDTLSTGGVSRPGAGDTLEFRYTLGPGRPRAQFAALVKPIQREATTFNRITLHARADHPVRLTVQLRASGAGNPPRWQRSIYLDREPRAIVVPWSDMHAVRPLGAGVPDSPPRADVGALMFVVDTNNTTPGGSGVIRFTDLAYER